MLKKRNYIEELYNRIYLQEDLRVKNMPKITVPKYAKKRSK